MSVYDFATQRPPDMEQIRARLRRMSDSDLKKLELRLGIYARNLGKPRGPSGHKRLAFGE